MNAFDQSGALDRVRIAPVALTSSVHGALSAGLLYRSATRSPIRRWVETLLKRFGQWWERARQRRQLMELDDHMLRDIGLSRAEVEFECHKSFWRS